MTRDDVRSRDNYAIRFAKKYHHVHVLEELRNNWDVDDIDDIE